MKKQLPILIVAALVIAGASFYGGMLYGKSTSTPSAAFRNQLQGRGQFDPNNQQGPNGQRANRATGIAGGLANGEILSADATSITVKLSDGGSRIVFLSDTTKVLKSTDGTKNDLKIGELVMVMGTANSDGSLAAESIQIRPALPVKPATSGYPVN